MQLCFVLLCTGRDWDRIADALRGQSTRAWRLLFLACCPKNDARFVVLMTMVLAFSLDTNDVVAEAGDAMDANVIVKWSPTGASVGSGRRANIRMSQDAEVPQHGTVEGFEDGRQQRKERICHECGKFGLGMNAREASAFEASKRVLAETTYVDMARVDLNTLEIGSVSLLERNRTFQNGIE